MTDMSLRDFNIEGKWNRIHFVMITKEQFGKEKRMRENYTRQDIINEVEDKDVEFIRLQFTDMFGQLKNMAVTSSQLEKALDNRFAFEGDSIEGFEGEDYSDFYLYPDLSTFEIFPWRPQQGKVARLICDVYTKDGEPFAWDSRNVLKRALSHAKEMGYTFQVGPECEFFLFHADEDGHPTTLTHEQAGYLDISPLDLGENARRDMVLSLEAMGFDIEASHHEQAPAQHEIDFKYDEALKTADNIMTFKMAVKTIARRHGLHATFMPKPKMDVNGSGMHLNMSLLKDGKNAFDDEKDELGLSKDAYYFIGGIMKHIKGITAITNPLVNSYKRLMPGFEAPVYIAWSNSKRSPLIRVPYGRGQETKIELRSPDSAANPYLALAVCLEAGLDGIKNKIMPPKSIDMNLFEISAAQCKEMGIDFLPDTLTKALDEMEKDSFVKEVLGEAFVNAYVDKKRQEWTRFKSQVTNWELGEYLYKY